MKSKILNKILLLILWGFPSIGIAQQLSSYSPLSYAYEQGALLANTGQTFSSNPTGSLGSSIMEGFLYQAVYSRVSTSTTSTDTLMHYDFSRLDSWYGSHITATNSIVYDLSSHQHHGQIVGSDLISYDAAENSLLFDGTGTSDGKGIFVKGIHYTSGDSDKIEKLTIRAQIKAKSENSGNTGDERILFSFDRSSVFRLSLGSDDTSIQDDAKGKLVFSFANSDGNQTVYNAINGVDLRDDAWHEIVVEFEAHKINGVNFYIDGQLTYSDPHPFKPIGDQATNESPRYGIVGNGNERSAENSYATNPDSMFHGWIKSIAYSTSTLPPLVALATSHTDGVVSPSEVVSITAFFSESMMATPTLSLSGIVSDVLMTATDNAAVWTYEWIVSNATVTVTTATVSGSDLAGNAYSGTDSLMFVIDNLPPSIVLSHTDADNIVSDSNVVTFTAYFSEKLGEDPKISLSGLLENEFMSRNDGLNMTHSTLWYGGEPNNQQNGEAFGMIKTNSGSYGVNDSTSTHLTTHILETHSASTTLEGYLYLGTFDHHNYFLSNAHLTWSMAKSYADARGGYLAVIDSVEEFNFLEQFTYSGASGGVWIGLYQDLNDPDYTEPSGGWKWVITESSSWSYTWHVSATTVTEVLVDISALDLAGNRGTLTVSEVFQIDNQGPVISFSDNDDGDGVLLKGQDIDLYIDSNEPLAFPPTLYENSIRHYNSSGYSFSNTTSESLYVATMSSTQYYRAYSVVNSDSLESGIVTFTLLATDLQGNSTTATKVYQIHGTDIGVYLSHSRDNSHLQSNDTLKLTAAFTEAIHSASLKIEQQGTELPGHFSMTVSPSTASKTWTYDWTVPNTLMDGNLSITVSAVGIYGNTYNGTESLTFVVDNSPPTVELSYDIPPSQNGVLGAKQAFKYYALFSESMIAPTISISSGQSSGSFSANLITEAPMQSENSSGTFWSYRYNDYSLGGYPLMQLDHEAVVTAVVSGTNLTGIPYTDNDIIELRVDKQGPRILNMEMTSPTSFKVTFDEPPFKDLMSYDQSNTLISSSVALTPYALQATDFEIVLNTTTAIQSAAVSSSISSSVSTSTTQSFTYTPTQLTTDGEVLHFTLNQLSDVEGGTLILNKNSVTIVDLHWNIAPNFENNELTISLDTDGDGVIDVLDQCPDTATGDPVDQNGCSDLQNDTDQDGVPNDIDLCPNTPTDEEADEEGCGISQADKDKDGIPDIRDNCPDTKNVLQKDSDGDGYGDACDPDPLINIVTYTVREDAEVGTLVGLVEAIDPLGGQIKSIVLEDEGYFELVNGNEIRIIKPLDYEEYPIYEFYITAQTEIGKTTTLGKVIVEDIPNTEFTAHFFISVFDLLANTDISGRSFQRYFNPFNRGVGKWKIRKSISGGNDAHLFVIKSAPPNTQKNEDESEGYLAFINPPDFNNPQDHNRDNVYEVEITYVNTEDGSPEVPVPVTQFQLQVPEGVPTSIELQSRPALPTDDTDGDGVPDIEDNSPVVFNPDQADADGDGVGDVSDDADHDGIWDPQDECPDTPLGTKVNYYGCEIFYLPPDNFRVYKTEKCAGSHQISIEFEDRTPNYIIEVSGQIITKEDFSGKKWNLLSLPAGQYKICITVSGVNPEEFERCFELELKDPPALTVDSNGDSFNLAAPNPSNVITFDLSGGDVYNITHNGITSQTARSTYHLTLKSGLNTIKITTGNECQGIFEEQYFKSETVVMAPNPFEDELILYIGGNDREVEVEIFSPEGRRMHSANYQLYDSQRKVSVDTSIYPMGSYMIKVNGEHIRQSFIAIKK